MSWAMWWLETTAKRAAQLAPERDDEDILTQLERDYEALPEEKQTAPGRPSAMPSGRVDEPGRAERVEGGA